MLISLHSDRLTLSHMTDKLVVLHDDPALPSLGLIDNGLISYFVYLLMLFKVIFFLATAKETTEAPPPSGFLLQFQSVCFVFPF